MSLWLLSVVLKVSTQKARYWLTLCADALTEANDSPIKSRIERQTIQNGWPPGTRPRLIRFSMVVPPNTPGRIGLMGPIDPISPIHGAQVLIYRGAKNRTIRLRSVAAGSVK